MGKRQRDSEKFNTTVRTPLPVQILRLAIDLQRIHHEKGTKGNGAWNKKKKGAEMSDGSFS